MCTVSFVFSKDKYIITSNRDEKTNRADAIAPKLYLINKKKIIFPKDPKAGGTWFAINDNGTVMVLLNGAKHKHLPKSNYKKSRGLILLDVMSEECCLIAWQNIDLENIEPFTLILFESKQLYHLQWDGTKKYNLNLPENKSYIWSSATLYTPEVITDRVNVFNHFITKTKMVSAKNVFQFHRYTQSNDSLNGLVINRNNQLKTLSITQSVIIKNKIKLKYASLMPDKVISKSLLII